MNFVFKGKECLKKLGSGQKPQELSQLRLKKKKKQKNKNKKTQGSRNHKKMCVSSQSKKLVHTEDTSNSVQCAKPFNKQNKNGVFMPYVWQ